MNECATHTVASLCLVHQHLPKPWVEVPISVYPICLNHQSAGYRMKLLYKDQQSGSPTKSATQYSWEMNSMAYQWVIGCAYWDIMKSIFNEDALLIAFRLCPCNFLKCCPHVLWSAQLEIPKSFVQLRVWYKTLRARMSGSSGTASTKVGCLLSILWLDEDTGIENATDTICTVVGITTMRAVSQWSKYDFQNLLVDVSLEVREFFGFNRWPAWRIWGINNLYYVFSFGVPTKL